MDAYVGKNDISLHVPNLSQNQLMNAVPDEFTLPSTLCKTNFDKMTKYNWIFLRYLGNLMYIKYDSIKRQVKRFSEGVSQV